MLAALADRRIAIAAAILLGVALDVTALVPAEQRPLATGVGTDIVRHAAAFERAWRGGAEAGGPAAGGARHPRARRRSDLAGLKRRDVYLVYIESYGTTVFDTPEFRSALRGPLAQFESALRAAGYTIASNRLVSPTFGGGSWLAHATLASGVRLDDPVLYAAAARVPAASCCPAISRMPAGARSTSCPGLRRRRRKPKAWGFDREVYAAELGYHGPSFGWFAIPDQFTLDRADGDPLGARFRNAGFHSDRARVEPHPVFAGAALSRRLARCRGFCDGPGRRLGRDLSGQPDWTALAPGYLKSLQYDFAVLGDWLAKHLPGNALVILLGDHQPPAVVGGELQQWTVPIHVLSRDPDLVAPFIAAGYVAGPCPDRKRRRTQGMESFLPSFLAAFDRSELIQSRGSNHNGQP